MNCSANFEERSFSAPHSAQHSEDLVVNNCSMIADGLRFAECPRWHEGELYFVDMYDSRVCRIGRDGRIEVVLEIEHPAGIGWLPDGDMLVVAAHECKIYRSRLGALEEVADLSAHGLAMLNDLIVRPEGDAYVGGLDAAFSSGQLPPTAIFHIRADGSVVVAADMLFGPNGMVITPDGKTLIVAESFASRLTAFDIDSDGSLSRRRKWASFADVQLDSVDAVLSSDAPLPDGIALDAEGAIWMADARGGGAVRVAEGGRILESRQFGDSTAVAVALGGDDKRTLFAMVAPPFERMASIFESEDRFSSIYSCPVSVGEA